jgi:hypothetical protein
MIRLGIASHAYGAMPFYNFLFTKSPALPGPCRDSPSWQAKAKLGKFQENPKSKTSNFK